MNIPWMRALLKKHTGSVSAKNSDVPYPSEVTLVRTAKDALFPVKKITA